MLCPHHLRLFPGHVDWGSEVTVVRGRQPAQVCLHQLVHREHRYELLLNGYLAAPPAVIQSKARGRAVHVHRHTLFKLDCNSRGQI